MEQKASVGDVARVSNPKEAIFGIWVFFLFLTSQCVFIHSVQAQPGALQLITRQGFWTNDLPDRELFWVQHLYYYHGDEMWNSNGKKEDIPDVDIWMSITRFVWDWHFGNEGQYQGIIEGIFPIENLSIGHESTSGLGDPYFYTQYGWNNSAKTSHFQAGIAIRFPFGKYDKDRELNLGANHFSFLPVLATQQIFKIGPGQLLLDASIGYMLNLKNKDNDYQERDYFEFNPIISYHLAKFSIYLQGDYVNYQSSEINGRDQHDSGYNVTLAPGIGYVINRAVSLDIKVEFGVDGKNSINGSGFNLRLMWIF